MPNKYQNNNLLNKVYNEGLEKGFNAGFDKGVEAMRTDLVYSVADELEQVVANVPGVGETLQQRIVEAVQASAKKEIDVAKMVEDNNADV